MFYISPYANNYNIISREKNINGLTNESEYVFVFM